MWLEVQDPRLSTQQEQENSRSVPDPFPCKMVGSGNKTNMYIVVHILLHDGQKTDLSVLGFFLHPGVFDIFSNLHWCSLHFPGAISCLFVKYKMAEHVYSLVASLHFRSILVSMELICVKYGVSLCVCFAMLSPFSFKRDWAVRNCRLLSKIILSNLSSI